MTPGVAALLDRLTDRKLAVLADLADTARDLDILLTGTTGKKAKEVREDIDVAISITGELVDLIAGLGRELRTE